MGVRKVLIVLVSFAVLLSLVPLGALGANRNWGTVSISLTGDVITPSYNIDQGHEIETVDFQIREYGSNTWRTVSRVDDFYESIHIPSSLFVAGNTFRLRVYFYDDPDGYTYSNTVSVPLPSIEFNLSIKNNNTVSWTWTGYPVTLHFIWYDDWSVIWDETYVTLPPNSPSQSITFDITQTSYDTIFQSSYMTEYEQLKYTLGVYATCNIAGRTITSNTVYRIGRDTLDSSPAETGHYYDPLVNDVQSHVNLIYRSARNTRVWYYVLSAIVVILPLCAVAFVIKRF